MRSHDPNFIVPALPRAQQAYRMMREAIASLEVQPGDILSENVLAKKLGMSRSPVRQALKWLEHDGLLATMPQRGTVVSKLDEFEVRDAVVIRRVLENWGLQEMQTNGRRPDLSELESLLAAQERASAAGEFYTFLELDTLFHEEILAGAGNRKAREVLRQINVGLLCVRSWTIRRWKTLTSGVDEHRRIYEALRQQAWDKVVDLVLAADDELVEAIVDMKKQKPEFFTDG